MSFIYLKPKNGDKKYKIPYQFVKRCTALRDTPKEDILELTVIKIERPGKDMTDNIHFYINDDLLSYVEEYFALWSADHATDHKTVKIDHKTVKIDHTAASSLDTFTKSIDPTDAENYTKEEPIETGDINKLLVEKDAQFISKFLEEYRKIAIERQYITVDEKNNSANYRTSIDIAVLSMLITQANDYLGIESLGNKIFIYIAAILWNKNDSDISEITEIK